jgi:hypothetical protein
LRWYWWVLIALVAWWIYRHWGRTKGTFASRLNQLGRDATLPAAVGKLPTSILETGSAALPSPRGVGCGCRS